jgi:peptide/nickel transport system ATP-binding protein/oligopeptide transport system ATP-binding protein
MVTPLLRIRDLCKEFSYGGIWGERVRVLEDIDLEVSPGEIRGIVGESGSGKTTLARCSLRLLQPSRGSVEFDGQDLACLSPSELRAKRHEFQMVFQDPFASLNPAMSVEDVLLEPLQIHGIGGKEFRDRRIRELLNDVSLSESLIRRRPHELSGGQQQRVGIARGLALKPRLLVADEPISALDVSVQAQILNLLADLKKRYGLTLILISHSLYAVHYLCTAVSVMYQGRIVEESPAVSFFRGPRHPYSRILLEAMPVMDPLKRGRARPAKKNEGRPRRSLQSCSFQPRCPHAFAVCSERVPLLTEVHPGEKVACFLYS